MRRWRCIACARIFRETEIEPRKFPSITAQTGFLGRYRLHRRLHSDRSFVNDACDEDPWTSVVPLNYRTFVDMIGGRLEYAEKMKYLFLRPFSGAVPIYPWQYFGRVGINIQFST